MTDEVTGGDSQQALFTLYCHLAEKKLSVVMRRKF
jgi:hypothetical protein